MPRRTVLAISLLATAAVTTAVDAAERVGAASPAPPATTPVAGTTTVYSWGDDLGKGNANCAKCGSTWDDDQTAPAGSFKANSFGLWDMHGNAMECCEHYDYEGAPRAGRSGSCVAAPGATIRASCAPQCATERAPIGVFPASAFGSPGT